MKTENEQIQALADIYARETVAALSDIKGFPLTRKQILGFLKIYDAYTRASVVLYNEDGTIPDYDLFLDAIYSDFHDFLNTDIKLDQTVCGRIILEFTIQKATAIYCFKNSISKDDEIAEAEEVFRYLISENRWEEIEKLKGMKNIWQEI